MELHLSECSSCNAELNRFSSLLSLLGTTSHPDVSQLQWTKMHDAVMAAIPVTPAKKFRLFTPAQTPESSLFLRPWSIAALVLLSIAGIGFVVKTYFLHHLQVSFLNQKQFPTITSLHGNSYTTFNGNNLPSSKDFLLRPGTQVRTENAASLQICVDAKTSLSLGKNTVCSVQKYDVSTAIFAMTQGTLSAEVSKRKPSQVFRIQTPNAICEVIGTRFDISTHNDSFRKRCVTTLVVHEGTVKFGSPSTSTYVTAGNAIAMFGDSIGTMVASSDSLLQQLHTASGFGLCTITSQPVGADLYIDGIPVGKTPITHTGSYGYHSLMLAKHGFQEWAGTLAITADALQDTFITMQKRSRATTNQPQEKNVTVRPEVSTQGSLAENSMLQDAFKLINAGDYSTAIRRLNTLLNTADVSSSLKAMAYHKLSICYKNTGKFQRAIRMLDIVLGDTTTNTQKPLALFERATIYKTALHNDTKAIEDYTRYLKLYSDDIWAEEAMLSLGELLHLTKNYQQAAEIYQTFCKKYAKNTHYEQVLFNLASIYNNNLIDYSRALTTYNLLIHTFPNGNYDSDARFWRANCLMQMGNPGRAIEEYIAYLNRYPDGKWSSEVKARLRTVATTNK